MKLVHGSAASMLLASLAIAGLAACNRPATTDRQEAKSVALDPILATPRIGDLYAAEVTYFSGETYSPVNSDEKSSPDESQYGLMKVIKTEPTTITLITEMEAWPEKQDALNDLRGDLADIEWDENEKIRLLRNELPQLVADKRILETRRPGAEPRNQ